MVSSLTCARPELSVRVDVGDASTTRTCRAVGDGFAVGVAVGDAETVAVEDVVARLTSEVEQADSSERCTVAAVVTVEEDVQVYALAERREGVWTDLRQPLEPVLTTWEDVRSGIVHAALDLLAAAGVTS